MHSSAVMLCAPGNDNTSYQNMHAGLSKHMQSDTIVFAVVGGCKSVQWVLLRCTCTSLTPIKSSVDLSI